MKYFISAILMIMAAAFQSHATVLFPFFVDIAPEYAEGNTETMAAAGVDCAMYHSTKAGFLASTFTEVENLFMDSMPGDVTRTERALGDNRLVVYTSVNTPDDTAGTGTLVTTIYVLRMPDDSFQAVYCEQRAED